MLEIMSTLLPLYSNPSLRRRTQKRKKKKKKTKKEKRAEWVKAFVLQRRSKNCLTHDYKPAGHFLIHFSKSKIIYYFFTEFWSVRESGISSLLSGGEWIMKINRRSEEMSRKWKKGVNPAFVAHIGHDFVYLFSPWFLRKEGRAKKS